MNKFNKTTESIETNSISTQNFEHIYRQYSRKVYQTCLRVTRDAMAAEDYTQDIFIKVFEKLRSFQNRSTVSTWLYSISYNYCMTQIKLGNRLALESLGDTLLEHEVPEVSTSADHIEENWQAREAALDRLQPSEILLLRLKYEHGLSIRQIGQQYSLSDSAVKMRLKRSREKLQRNALHHR